MRDAEPELAGAQILLELPTRVDMAPESFLRSPSNARAHDLVLCWPDWPERVLLLWGAAGSGKSHLAASWRARAGAVVVPAADLDAWRRERRLAHAILCEDIDRAHDERAILHFMNDVRSAGGSCLFTARTPASEWTIALADLRSRVRALCSVEIEPPDDALLASLIVKHAIDRQLRVGEDVVHYLVSRMERSAARAEQLVALLDRLSLERRRAVTKPLAREALAVA